MKTEPQISGKLDLKPPLFIGGGKFGGTHQPLQVPKANKKKGA